MAKVVYVVGTSEIHILSTTIQYGCYPKYHPFLRLETALVLGIFLGCELKRRI